jgi:signal peptidase II
VTLRLLRLAALAAAIVALDQWTKAWATRTLAGRPPVEIIGEFVRLTYTRNSGVAFGLGAGLPFPYYVFSIAAVVVILWLFARQKVAGTSRQVALALILGGAIGNLIDRVTAGEVVDFIEVGWRRWHWPVFNVADSAVSIGVVMFAFTWPRKSEPHAAEASDESARVGGAGAEPGGAPRPLPGDGADRPLA